MSDQSLSTARAASPQNPPLPPVGRIVLRSLAISAAIVLVAFGPGLARHGLGPLLGALRAPHLPDFRPILQAPLAIKLHLATILSAILVGAVLMSGVKGRRLHRVLGWTWAGLLLFTATAALFIRAPTGLPNIAGIGVLHLFSAVTLLAAPLGVHAAKRHDVARHARIMTSLFVGGVGVAGFFAFLPGRLLWQVVFG